MQFLNQQKEKITCDVKKIMETISPGVLRLSRDVLMELFSGLADEDKGDLEIPQLSAEMIMAIGIAIGAHCTSKGFKYEVPSDGDGEKSDSPEEILARSILGSGYEEGED